MSYFSKTTFHAGDSHWWQLLDLHQAWTCGCLWSDHPLEFPPSYAGRGTLTKKSNYSINFTGLEAGPRPGHRELRGDEAGGTDPPHWTPYCWSGQGGWLPWGGCQCHHRQTDHTDSFSAFPTYDLKLDTDRALEELHLQALAQQLGELLLITLTLTRLVSSLAAFHVK